MFFGAIAASLAEAHRREKAALAAAAKVPKVSQHMKTMALFQEQTYAWEAAKTAALLAGDTQHAAACEKQVELLCRCIQNCIRSERERIAGVEPGYFGI